MTVSIQSQLGSDELAAIFAEANKAALAAVQAFRQKDAAGNPTGPYSHGPGGLFSVVPQEHPILSAMVQPRGLLAELPIVRADRHVREHFSSITGVTAGEGCVGPDGVCDDPYGHGSLKICTQIVPFGRQINDTSEVDVFHLSRLRDPWEEISFASAPQQMMRPDNFFPMSGVAATGNFIHSEWGRRIYLLAVQMQRCLCPLVYVGDPTNNTAGQGHMETPGLDIWINQNNKVDAWSGAVCTALNSDIKDFGYNSYDGVSPDLVTMIHDVYAYLNWNATEMGLDPATWGIAMDPNLFHLLTEIWPCRYYTDRCANTAGTNVVVMNDDFNRSERQAMRNGRYLLIDGEKVPVTPDSCIPREDWDDTPQLGEGEYASDIYIYPKTILGGMVATGYQYYDQRWNIAEIAPYRYDHAWDSDDGMFLWGATFNGAWCEALKVAIEYRLFMLTPQLAGRIMNVKYAPRQVFRDWNPDEKHFLDGGVTSGPDYNFYSMWDNEYIR